MSRITRWSMHRGVKGEHVRAEDTAHRNSHVINAACGSQQTRYLDTLLRSYTRPRSQFIGTKSHPQHAIWTESSGSSLQCHQCKTLDDRLNIGRLHHLRHFT